MNGALLFLVWVPISSIGQAVVLRNLLKSPESSKRRLLIIVGIQVVSILLLVVAYALAVQVAAAAKLSNVGAP
jgi:undecaprenyl pyrophosphate phosphatase UppP